MSITSSSNAISSNGNVEIIADLQKPLYITKIDPQDRFKIGQIAVEWQRIAIKKWHETDMYDEKAAWLQLRGNHQILGEIERYCTDKEQDHHASKELYVCKDMHQHIQGIAIIERKLNEVVRGHLLATNPINIRCKANLSESKRVEGVGRTFIEFAQQEMASQGIAKITLNPINSAIFFYLKFGFQLKDGEMIKQNPTSPKFLSAL